LPGGLQDLDESITDTLEREIFEELGLKLKAGKLISIYTSNKWDSVFSSGDQVQQFLLFFKMHGDFYPDDIKIQKSELLDFDFFDFNQLPDNTMECCKEKCNDLLLFSDDVIFH